MTRSVCAVVAVLALNACGSDTPAPAPTPIPACQTNNTATVVFQNRSTSNTTYDVLVDGIRQGTISPNQNSPTVTLAAGVAHTVRFQITNTSLLACNTSTPTYAQCSSNTLSCGF